MIIIIANVFLTNANALQFHFDLFKMQNLVINNIEKKEITTSSSTPEPTNSKSIAQVKDTTGNKTDVVHCTTTEIIDMAVLKGKPSSWRPKDIKEWIEVYGDILDADNEPFDTNVPDDINY